MLDQLRLALDDVPNGDAYISLAILASMRLRRPAPAAVEQRDRGLHARALVLAAARDAGDRVERGRAVAARQ